ncbi:hypothetical protein N7522_002964 [Penicillium canescens]|nr:hypothetical protein N7522_002964 [Penicillium canescens]
MESSASPPEPFSSNDLATSCGVYSNPHVTGLEMEEDDSRRVGGLGSMPDTNGVRYDAHQPTIQDLQDLDLSFRYSGSSALTMTPPALCPDLISPSSGPVFPHASQLEYSFDRMDFQLMSALQIPANIPDTIRSSWHPLNPIPALMGGNSGYGGLYHLHRGIVGDMGLSLAGKYDVLPRNQYSGTPQALGNLERTQSTLYQQPMMDSSQRSQPHIEGPPFNDTTFLETIVAEFGGQHQTLKPEIQAKMGRSFFLSDGIWTCYRRNYFSVTCGFGLHPWPHSVSLYIRYPDQTVELIRGFSMAISAVVLGQNRGETREIVQHTPKRDKQSERKPGRVILQSSPPASHSATSNSNGNLSGFPLGSRSMDYNSSLKGAPQPYQPPTSHVFKRIQFREATAKHGKHRTQQQYYNLVVELYAEIASSGPGETQWVQIARRYSHPMVVRGRSPGHYKDRRGGP